MSIATASIKGPVAENTTSSPPHDKTAAIHHKSAPDGRPKAKESGSVHDARLSKPATSTKAGGSSGRRLVSRWFSSDQVYPDAGEAVSIEEAEALLKYVAEKGLDRPAKFTGPLLKAVTDCRTAENANARVAHYHDLYKHYSALTAQPFIPSGVNGRTIIDTENLFLGTFWIIALGLVFFVCGVAMEVFGLYFRDVTEVSQPGTTEAVLFKVHEFGGRFLSPFFWGGVGTCVYLAKSLSEKASNQAFDSRRLYGHRARVFLGAVFAVIVVEIFQLRPGEITNGINIAPNATAFLCGLGVKAVYAAFEKLVDTIHDRIKGMGAGSAAAPVVVTSRR